MPLYTPVAEAELSEEVRQTYDRLKEALQTETIPDIFLYYSNVPGFLKDLYMNYKKFVLSAGKLDVTSKMLIAFSVACMKKNATWRDYLAEQLVNAGTSDQTLKEVIAVVAACEMYNTFFKFRDLSGKESFSGLSVGLRAHTFKENSLGDKMVELINIAISDLNGCKPCVTGHLRKAEELGVTDDQIQETIQCSATMAGAISFLNGIH